MSTPVRPETLHALTGIRILAAGAVFFSHVPVPPAVPEVARTFMASGYNGVTLFFILSGFVLTWSYAERLLPISGKGLWSFAVARFARIYPLYLLGLLVIVVPLIIRGDWDPLMLLHASTLQVWSGNIGRAFAYNSPGWSIGVEVFLYACFPVLIWALVKVRHRPGILVSIALAAVAVSFALAFLFIVAGRDMIPFADPDSAHRWLYRTPLSRLGDFALGSAIALLVMRKPGSRRLAIGAQVVGAISIVGLMCFRPLLYSAWSWDAAYMLPAALLFWGLASAPHAGISRVLSTRPMVLLGEASFAFYILHWSLVGNQQLISVVSAWSWVATAGGALIVMLLISLAAHFAVERPAQRWLRATLSPRRQRPHASPAEAPVSDQTQEQSATHAGPVIVPERTPGSTP